jgi:hypothetical protein
MFVNIWILLIDVFKLFVIQTTDDLVRLMALGCKPFIQGFKIKRVRVKLNLIKTDQR